MYIDQTTTSLGGKGITGRQINNIGNNVHPITSEVDNDTLTITHKKRNEESQKRRILNPERIMCVYKILTVYKNYLTEKTFIYRKKQRTL